MAFMGLNLQLQPSSAASVFNNEHVLLAVCAAVSTHVCKCVLSKDLVLLAAAAAVDL